MSAPSSAQRLQSSASYAVAWTTTPANYDVRTSDPGRAGEVGRYSRAIMVGTAGTLVVTRADGTNVTITFASGQQLDIVAANLVATGSTAQDVLVLW